MNNYGSVYSVYIHTCPNNKKYIGMTRQAPSKRWRNGQGYRHQKRFYEDIKKYGWDNITHEIVLENSNLGEAQNLERELISQFNTTDIEFGYNTKKGGETFGEHSEDFLKKLHDRMINNTYCVGRKLSQKHIEALRKSNLGTHRPCKHKGKCFLTDEGRQRISKKTKERFGDIEYREKCLKNLRFGSGVNNPMYGKKHSEKTKELIRQKAKGRVISEEAKRKMSESNHNKKRVFKYDENDNFICEYPSLKTAADSVRGNSTNIGFACRHTNRTYKGYRWRYANDNS